MVVDVVVRQLSEAEDVVDASPTVGELSLHFGTGEASLANSLDAIGVVLIPIWFAYTSHEPLSQS